MHFTLWATLTAREGGHAEISWENFREFVAHPVEAEVKTALEGWSPARFTGNRRARAAAEVVSCIVLDDDASGLPLERVCAIWASVSGLVHSSFSHTEAAPKWRIVLRCSRDMTPDEHARVWRAVREVAAAQGQAIDEATKDPSRLWFAPARRPGALYEWRELDGAALPVDAILAERLDAAEAPRPTPAGPASDHAGQEPRAGERTGDPTNRRAAMAAALGAAWPNQGRHAAQLALAGALRAEGFPQAEALDFLCAVCAAAGDEDRPKRAKTIEHTYALDAGAPMTSWSRLKLHVDPVIVDAARGALGRGASLDEAINRRMAEAAASVRPPAPASTAPEVARVTFGRVTFDRGGYDAELPPIDYQVDGLIEHGDVVMFVAHGNSMKTWLAMSLADAVASGRPWLGRFLVHRGRAAIVDFESGSFEVRRRLKLLGTRDATVGDRLLHVSYPEASFTDPETWVDLAGAGLDLVVVDSFNAATPGQDENDARAALMLQQAGRFAELTRCTSLFIHHARKGAGGGDAREAVRGSTALYAACDRVFLFKNVEKDDGGIVRSTMSSIKDGAGRAPADVCVELSDQGLRYVEPPAVEVPENPSAGDLDEQNKAIVFGVLNANPAGVEKSDLIDVMHGRHEQRRDFLARIKLMGLVTEYREPSGGRGRPKLFITLKV